MMVWRKVFCMAAVAAFITFVLLENTAEMFEDGGEDDKEEDPEETPAPLEPRPKPKPRPKPRPVPKPQPDPVPRRPPPEINTSVRAVQRALYKVETRPKPTKSKLTALAHANTVYPQRRYVCQTNSSGFQCAYA
jgi:outer membrane biosynthesis protein TonB